jgi:hypothetical protein
MAEMMSAKTKRKMLKGLRFFKFSLTIIHLNVIIFIAKALGELVGLLDLLLGAVVGGHPGSIALPCRSPNVESRPWKKSFFSY